MSGNVGTNELKNLALLLQIMMLHEETEEVDPVDELLAPIAEKMRSDAAVIAQLRKDLEEVTQHDLFVQNMRNELVQLVRELKAALTQAERRNQELERTIRALQNDNALHEKTNQNLLRLAETKTQLIYGLQFDLAEQSADLKRAKARRNRLGRIVRKKNKQIKKLLHPNPVPEK